MANEISPTELSALLGSDNRIRIIDCREPEEFDICSIPKAQLIPLNNIAHQAAVALTDKNERIVVYCHHGLRSLRAATLLSNMGFQNVTSLHGGIDAWSCEVDPTVPRY